ncbi:hypothetical protein [Pedobacter agri]|uniref:hypothetical protein n=1 Tax=Pedobacter agri TaxID=454586 RepID=UPI00292DD7D2|nr:hypothetical protein [Pedobacter agri]
MESELHIMRNNSVIAIVNIDENTGYTSEFLGTDQINASFLTNSILPLQVHDYVVFNGKKYSIKDATQCEQIDSETFKYDIIFYGEIFAMYDVLVMHLGRTSFSYTGTPLDLLELLIDCLNSEQTGWAIAQCSLISEPQTFNFNGQSCRTALTAIADTFNLEYLVDGKKISLIEKVGDTQNISLKYGRGKGLFKASRQNVDQGFATVWYGYGGNQNLPDNYRGGMDRIALDAPVTMNVDLYGRKQGTVTFEDEFPQRTATITAVNSIYEVIDSSLDFDINLQQINDGGAKIVFKSGELSGQQFVIKGYNPSTKAIRFGSIKESTGYELPNASFQAKVGDKYTLIGIVMPQSYVTASEQRVMSLLFDHAKRHSFPPVAFPLDIDEKYIREMGLIGKIIPGDSIHVSSDSLGVDAYLRIQSISFPLVNPANIQGVVSDTIQYTQQEKIIKEVKQNGKETANSVAVALYARQVADEISNAAIMEQFKRTYIGDRAILTGAFVAGNPDAGEVAGINGTENEPNSVRFWAGSSFEDKDKAPFRVQQDGKMFAIDAIIKGVIEALSGKIANFIIGNEGLTNDDDNAFIALKKTVDNLHQISIALGIGIPVDYWGWGTANAALSINNTLSPDGSPDSPPNIGIQIDVANGAQNFALDIIRGNIAFRSGSNIVIQEGQNLRVGLDFEAQVKVKGVFNNDKYVTMKWVKGVLVSAVDVV